MDNFIQSPVTTNKPRKKKNVPNERRISSDILAEMIKVFNRLTLQSTINNSSDYHSEKNDAKSDPKIDQVVATHTSDKNKIKVTDTDTTDRNSPHKLLINRLIPYIIPVIILSVNQTNVDGVAASGGTLHAVHTILSKEIFADAARGAAHVFKRSYGGILEVHRQDNFTGRKHFFNSPQIDHPSLDWLCTLGLPK